MIDSHDTSNKQFIAPSRRLPLKYGQYFFSSHVRIIKESDKKDVSYWENYIPALHITLTFIVLERKTQPFAAKKNIPVFFWLCKNTVVCFWIYFDKPQAHEPVKALVYIL